MAMLSGFLIGIPLIVRWVGRLAGALPTVLRIAARGFARHGRRTGAALAVATQSKSLESLPRPASCLISNDPTSPPAGLTPWVCSTSVGRLVIASDREESMGGDILNLKRNITALALVSALVATASPALAVAKGPVKGAVNRKGPATSYTSVVNRYVIELDWADIQTSDGGIIQTSVIDPLLAEADSLGQKVKVRIFTGTHDDGSHGAPQWVLDKCLTVDLQVSATAPFYPQPRFWTTCFELEYEDLMVKLAEIYDSNDTFRAIAMCGGSTFYCEPLVRQAFVSAANRQNLSEAMYTVAQDRTRIGQMIDDHAVWATTRTFMAFNPYQWVDQDGVAQVDEAFTENKMDDCRSSLGTGQCILQNNSIRSSYICGAQGLKFCGPGDYPAMYAAMDARAKPIQFQTAKCSEVGDLNATLKTAAESKYLGQAVELPEGYSTSGSDCFITLAHLTTRDTELEAN